MFSDLPLPSLLGLIGVLLLSLSWHEAAHAWVADRLGDPTARSLGRVTLNPIKHLDLFLSVLLPATLIPNPYGTPTPDVPSILAFDADDPWRFALQMGFFINISLALFNLLPIPPLDGSRIVGWLLPRPLKPYWYRIDRFAFVMIIGLLVLLNSSAAEPIFRFIEGAWFHAAETVDTLAWKVMPA